MNYELDSRAAMAGLFDANFRNKIDVPANAASVKAGEAVFYNPDTKTFTNKPSEINVFLGIAMFSHLDGEKAKANYLSILQEGVIWVKVAEGTDANENLEISDEGIISDEGAFAFDNALLPFDAIVETAPNKDTVMHCIVNVQGGKILEELE
jgi:hypothetical protein